MADYTTVLTATSSVSDAILTAYAQGFLVASTQANVVDQLTSWKEDIGAKAIELPRFSTIAVDTLPIPEREDIDSTEVTASKQTYTPIEYGLAVTKTELASIQTGGKVDLAISRQVGEHLGRKKNKLGVAALDASTNVAYAGNKTEATLAATDVVDRAFFGKMRNRLARASVPFVNGSYIWMGHDDNITDLLADVSAGSWTSVNQYQNSTAVLNQEIGEFGGFRIVRNNDSTFGDQSGAGTVDIYNSYFMGFNALGYVQSKAPTMTFTGPFDKLGRIVNVGWHGIFTYGIVEQAALYVGRSASSVGNNAA